MLVVTLAHLMTIMVIAVYSLQREAPWAGQFIKQVCLYAEWLLEEFWARLFWFWSAGAKPQTGEDGVLST